MKKLLSLILALSMILCLLAACGGDSPSSAGTAPEVSADSASAGDAAETAASVAAPADPGDYSTYLQIAETEDADTIDPQVTTDYYTVGMNIFNRLVEVQAHDDGTSEIVPSLATDWTISDDGLTYTFTLAQGVKYSNGADFTASDVYYTVKRMMTYDKARNRDIYDMIVGAQDVADGKADEISGIKVIDDYTVEITLNAPYAAFLACLTTPGASMYDEETTEAAGDQFGIDPAVTIGTGYFIFDSWELNNQMVLRANPDCWAGAPACNGVIIRIVPDEATQRMMFESGQLDLLDLDNAPTQMEYFLSQPQYESQIVSGQRVGISYIGLNESYEPLSHVEVRQALQRSLDRQQILDALFSGQGMLENGIFPHGLIGYNPDLPAIPYDVEAAKQLMADAGYADGFDLEFCYSSDAGQTTRDLAAICQNQWKAIGVNVILREIDDGSYLDMRKSGELQCYTATWSADFNDPDNFIYTFFGTVDNSIYRGFNYLDESKISRVSGARAIVDEEERVAEYQALEKEIFQDDAVWVPLYSKQHLYVVNPRVTGFKVSWNGWSSNYYQNVGISA